MMHHSVETQEFKREHIQPFDEMIVSWNGIRPKNGTIKIEARVFLNGWTPWLNYALWGSESQSSMHEQADSVKVYQDTFDVLNGKKATGFHIKLDSPMRIHVFTNQKRVSSIGDPDDLNGQRLAPIRLKVGGLSQMALAHPRNQSICSPTSVTAVVRYLTGSLLDPIFFAEKVKDFGFDIFGNWVLNVAESSMHLGPSWNVWVERLQGFQDIHKRLEMGTPVVVSVRGPLNGSARAYAEGHLIVVAGFDPIAKEVYCMDPAFETDDQTHVCYRLDDFLCAWERRGRAAYIFEKNRNLRDC